MQEFKDRLKELREEQGLSMKELGLKIGVSDASVCKWENGVSEPKITYILRLSEFFECSTDYLLGVTDDFASSGYYGKTVNDLDENAFAEETHIKRGNPFVVNEPESRTEEERKENLEFYKRKFR